MALDEGTACMADHRYIVHPHTGDTWHYVIPGEDGKESISLLPECDRQGDEVSALAKVAEEWVWEAGGAEQGTGTQWTVRAIRRARYRREEWMTREDTMLILPVAMKGPAAAQWREQAVHMLLRDDRLGDRGTVELDVRHG